MARDRSADAFLNRSTRLILDNLPQLVAVLDAEMNYVFANRAHHAWFGLGPAALTGRPIRDVIGDKAYGILEAHCFTPEPCAHPTFVGHVPFAHGGRRYVHCSAVATGMDPEKGDNIVLVATDLTEFKLIEQALGDSTKRNESIMATAVDGIIVIDTRGIIQSFNQGAERQFGYAAAEVVGRNVSMLMPMPDAQAHDGHIRRYLETGERRIIGIGREVHARRKDGTEFPIELAVGEFAQGGQRYFTGFTRDITARKNAERTARQRLDELAQVTRRSSMNNFATGFAHEVNQPLTAIVTMAQAQLRNLRAGRSDPGALEQSLEMIARQGVRISGIVQQMRDFLGKQRAAGPSLHRPETILVDALHLLEYELLARRITVHREFQEDVGAVLVNRIQIEQVVFNVIQNAVQAMQTIEGDRVLTLGVRKSVTAPGLVEIAVSDTGIGLPDEAERIFEPFFTTREDGMGQGLSISRSIVEAHGGTIRALRNPGCGTTMVVTLPLAREEDN
jgi:two-component system sensor kinase FixL